MTETIFSCVIGSSKVSVAHPANIMMMILLTLALALDVTGTVSSVSDAADALAVPSVEESSVHHSRNLIINGQTAVRGRYPYFVTLGHYCGGALIAQDVVLAAGHCKGVDKHWMKARVGTYNFHNDVRNVDYKEFRIGKQVRHPRFEWVSDDEFVHDFLLLKLRRASSNDATVLRLNRYSHIPALNQQVTAMGVGNTEPDFESKSNVLKEVTLNAISNEVCATSFDLERNLTYSGHIYPSMMCTTGGTNNERDACAYDSGSPIIIPGRTAEEDLLVGIVSWGEDCVDPDFPGVNARVSDAFDWIQANVCAMSDFPPADLCLYVPAETKIWKVLAAAFGVTVLVLVASRCYGRSSQNRKYSLDRSDSSLDELEDLKTKNPKLSKFDSYESVGVELP